MDIIPLPNHTDHSGEIQGMEPLPVFAATLAPASTQSRLTEIDYSMIANNIHYTLGLLFAKYDQIV